MTPVSLGLRGLSSHRCQRCRGGAVRSPVDQYDTQQQMHTVLRSSDVTDVQTFLACRLVEISMPSWPILSLILQEVHLSSSIGNHFFVYCQRSSTFHRASVACVLSRTRRQFALTYVDKGFDLEWAHSMDACSRDQKKSRNYQKPAFLIS